MDKHWDMINIPFVPSECSEHDMDRLFLFSSMFMEELTLCNKTIIGSLELCRETVATCKVCL